MNVRSVPEKLAQFVFIRKFIQKRKLCCHPSSPTKVLGESKKCGGLGAVAPSCNPSYLGGKGWRFVV
jgi:hypothetical protein